MCTIFKEIDCKINLCFYSARMQEIRQNLKTLIYLFVQINAVYACMNVFIYLFIYLSEKPTHVLLFPQNILSYNCFNIDN